MASVDNERQNDQDRSPQSELLNTPRFCEWAKRINRPDIPERLNPKKPMVYFSAEYGLPEMGYSGGLGILAADHVKQAVNLNYPAYFIGLGYESRREDVLCNNEDGGKIWTPGERPLKEHQETGMTVTLKDANNNDWCIKVCRHEVSKGNTQLLTLQVPGSVYPGEPWSSERLANDVALGFGGYEIIKQLREKGTIEEPAFYHLNESSTVFGALAALDDLTARYNGDYKKALKEIMGKTILTNHTLVPAAEAKFTRQQCQIIFNNIKDSTVREHLEQFITERGGELAPLDLALYLAGQYNGVCEDHAEIAANIFTRQYGRPFEFRAVTNGIHPESWNPRIMALLKRQGVLDKFGMPIDNPIEYARRIDAIEIKDMLDRKKARVAELRQYLSEGKRVDQFGETVNLPEDAVIVGFARRVTEYKRWPLMFRDIDKLKDILEKNPKAHIVMSGQPHPNDKGAIRDFEEVKKAIADNPLLRKRIHLMPNWTPDFAKVLTPACHVWLNNPRVGEEACGTSGMKTELGGALQVSTIDGFYAELPKDSFYAIEGPTNSGEELDSLYQQLGKAIADAQDPQKWADGVKKFWKGNPEKRESGLHIASGARMLAMYTNMALPIRNLYTPSSHRTL